VNVGMSGAASAQRHSEGAQAPRGKVPLGQSKAAVAHEVLATPSLRRIPTSNSASAGTVTPSAAAVSEKTFPSAMSRSALKSRTVRDAMRPRYGASQSGTEALVPTRRLPSPDPETLGHCASPSIPRSRGLSVRQVRADDGAARLVDERRSHKPCSRNPRRPARHVQRRIATQSPARTHGRDRSQQVQGCVPRPASSSRWSAHGWLRPDVDWLARAQRRAA
jgi:hypothetical protein